MSTFNAYQAALEAALEAAPALPTKTVVQYDWEAVIALLLSGERPVYRAQESETRVLNAYALRHHKMPVYYRTLAPGLICFSLTPFKQPTKRSGKGTTR